jgi:hypothetical protein
MKVVEISAGSGSTGIILIKLFYASFFASKMNVA